MQKIYCFIIGVLCLFTIGVQAQNITGAEYFFNTDPGFGNGTAFTGITAAVTISNVTNNADISLLPNGINTVYVRVKDANQHWSITNNQSFLKLSQPPISNIVTAEYFFNTDPGFGKGSTLGISSGSTVTNYTQNVDISTLPNGCLLYTSPSPRDRTRSRMPSSA